MAHIHHIKVQGPVSSLHSGQQFQYLEHVSSSFVRGHILGVKRDCEVFTAILLLLLQYTIPIVCHIFC